MVQSEQLDDLWRRVFAAIAQGDLAQIDRALKILKRRADLWGLDAPRQHEISGPGGSSVRTDVGDLLIARLEELRDRQGPLAEDLDDVPLAMLPPAGPEANGAGLPLFGPPLPASLVDIFPPDESDDGASLGDDSSDGDGHA